MLGTVFVHLGANTINDYFDWDDSDRDNPYAGPFSGGSRHRMEGSVERRHFLFQRRQRRFESTPSLVCSWSCPWWCPPCSESASSCLI